MTAVIDLLNDEYSVAILIFGASLLLTIGFAVFARLHGERLSAQSLYIMILRSATVTVGLVLLVAFFLSFDDNFDLITFLVDNNFLIIVASMITILVALKQLIWLLPTPSNEGMPPRPAPANKEKP